MSFNALSLLLPLLPRASRAMGALCIGTGAERSASRAYKPPGNAPPA